MRWSREHVELWNKIYLSKWSAQEFFSSTRYSLLALFYLESVAFNLLPFSIIKNFFKKKNLFAIVKQWDSEIFEDLLQTMWRSMWTNLPYVWTRNVSVTFLSLTLRCLYLMRTSLQWSGAHYKSWRHHSNVYNANNHDCCLLKVEALYLKNSTLQYHSV